MYSGVMLRRRSTHRQPETILRLAYDAFRSPDAWWRLLPSDKVELIKHWAVPVAMDINSVTILSLKCHWNGRFWDAVELG